MSEPSSHASPGAPRFDQPLEPRGASALPTPRSAVAALSFKAHGAEAATQELRRDPTRARLAGATTCGERILEVDNPNG